MHLISLKDWTREDILSVVERSIDIKRFPDRYGDLMQGRSLALLFQKTSTRTRCAGEIGMTQLGGHSLFLDWGVTNFVLTDFQDEIRVLSDYVDVILARLLKHSDVIRAAEVSSVPVINGCCDRYHPTQILADLMTIQEKLGRVEGVKLTYVGIHNNVCNSLIAAGAKVGMEVTVVAPITNPAAVDDALFEEACRTGLCRTSTRLSEAIAESDVVYTDTWVDMEFFGNPEFESEKQRRIELMQPYQLNNTVMEGHNALVMHCLPAHRGYEISGELMHDPRSIVFEQSENRLYGMKGLVVQIMRET
ncbi:MAG: ornithine carbamoyltransferase [Candidatus Poribacteria bacterium]|nr:ornithine carbamoyltransferase [Candidatus Poribacteria bacterium]